MMDQSLIQSLAAQLVRASDARTRLEPFSNTHPDLALGDAYRIQLEYVAQRCARGERVIGKKLGATSKAVQQILKTDAPLFGFLFESFRCSDRVALADFFQPRLEPELAFVMKTRLAGSNITVDDVLRATEGVCPAFEIPDTALMSWQIPVTDLVAANVYARGIVLGSKMTRVENLDLVTTGVVVEKKGAIIATSATAAALGNPARAVAWLAHALVPYDQAIEPGDIILTGTTTPMIEIQLGDAFTATFGSGLGNVSVRFE